ICKDIIRNNTLRMYAMESTNYQAWLYNLPTPNYKTWKEYTNNDFIAGIIDRVDRHMNSIDLSLSGFRIVSRDKEIKKTVFEADLNYGNGQISNIIVEAQYSTDGRLYVSVDPF
ncbi:MAG: hypothetical protein R6V77_00480, partial [Candidatus Cloacimonadaceae bacterium]